MSTSAEAMKTLKTSFKWALLAMLVVEPLSLIGHVHPIVSVIGFFVVVGAAAALSFVDLSAALLFVVAELALGSQGGYLFSVGPEEGVLVSLRIGLFLAVFSGWLGRSLVAVAKREWQSPALEWWFALRRSGLLAPYLSLLGVFVFAALNGWWRGNGFGNVFFDANGYAYFALLPAFVAASAAPRFFSRAAGVVFAAITVSVAKSLFVLYIFSHRMFDIAPAIYVWIRDTRVGEITVMTGDFYRVFFQSHVFALAAIFWMALVVAYARSWRDGRTKAAGAVFIWSLTGLLMGLSRSFWFGLFAGAVGLAAVLLWGHASRRVWQRLVLLSLVAVPIAATIIFAVYAVPYPRRGANISFTSLLGERALSLSGDAASNSRWQLLPVLTKACLEHPLLGSGFGKTVTYRTSDPRQLIYNPTGAYTTYAFEWGYQDMWLKYGLVGLAVYGWFLWRLMRPLAALLGRQRSSLADQAPDEQKTTAIVAVGFAAAVLAVLATNVFSPYLNHPLGIGLLMLIGLYGWRQSSRQSV